VFDDWRIADQRWYVSDPTAFARLTGWEPRTGVRDGVSRLHGWLLAQRAGVAAAVTEATI
jgi:CDP-paratose 2-epimerase